MAIQSQNKKIEEVLTRGVEKVLPSQAGLADLMKKREIRLYLGIDPTGRRLHLGHTIALRKLQEFSALGHEAILVVGTGTVLAGDPSQRQEARPLLREEEIKDKIRSWKEQANKILDLSQVKIRYNGQWLLNLGLKDIIQIASKISAVSLFQREMFQTRIKKGGTVWTHELLYPLLQGYDSVFLKTDLEIGGTDQTFNMLIGRELEKKMLGKEKFVLTVPMILGTDGRPMSKTSGNCIWLEDSAEQMFGKVMSIPDGFIGSYFELLTRLPIKEVNELKDDLKRNKINPRDVKARLGREIVQLYHGRGASLKAEQEFERVFKQKGLPQDIPVLLIKEKELSIVDLLIKAKLATSKAEAKRLILQKGVRLQGKVEADWQKVLGIKKGMVLQVGKRRFARIN